jgi:hypothetical protein
MDNQRKILEMLADKKITVDEAERLMTLVNPEEKVGTEEPRARRGSLKYLRIEVIPKPGLQDDEPQDTVKIRVPIALIRAGIKLTAFLPPEAYNKVDSALKEKGIDFDIRNIKPEQIEELIQAINELEIDVQNSKQTVKIFAE